MHKAYEKGEKKTRISYSYATERATKWRLCVLCRRGICGGVAPRTKPGSITTARGMPGGALGVVERKDGERKSVESERGKEKRARGWERRRPLRRRNGETTAGTFATANVRVPGKRAPGFERKCL